MITENELLDKFAKIKTWQSGGKRGVHKPLLILYAIKKLQEGKLFVTFEELEPDMKRLIESYGPFSKSNSYHPEYPFIRLANDGVWCFNQTINTKEDASVVYLREQKVAGGFEPEISNLLSNNIDLQKILVEYILENNFSDSIHHEIIESVGLEFNQKLYTSYRKPRDSNFRPSILAAYEYKCAVCNYNVRIGNNVVGLEAAHVKWHQAGGPDTEVNGMALCSLHHKLFDLGAYKINENLQLIVSEKANGTFGLNEWLLNFHKKPINRPVSKRYDLDEAYLSWHVQEVFKGYERD